VTIGSEWFRVFHCIMHQRMAYFFSALSLQLLFSPFCLS
jgi:hypothetical protein